MNKKLLALGAAFSPALLFAEGGSSVDTTTATGAITSIQTALTSVLGSLSTAVVAVVLAGVAVWLIPRIAGSLKSAFSSGKGR